jgi:DNA adenine methylase
LDNYISQSKPLIRWAGSKRKLLPKLMVSIPTSYSRYVEPFCGSACLFFELSPDRALLSDINYDLINAFRQIKQHKNIYDELVSIPNTAEEYYRLRALDPLGLNARERAKRFLYLNRYCFNGVYHTNQSGQFNVPRGTRTGDFPSFDIFDNARRKLSKAKLNTISYEHTLKELQEGDFVYIDPPYSKAGGFTGEYGLGSFDAKAMPEFVNILSVLNKKRVKFLFSYRACNETIKLLNDEYKVETLSVKRHVSGFKSGWNDVNEILVKNY